MSVCDGVDKLLKKYVFFTFWHVYFRWGNHNPGSTLKAELCTIQLLRIWHNSGFQISDNLLNYLNTIVLRATLPCSCNLVKQLFHTLVRVASTTINPGRD